MTPSSSSPPKRKGRTYTKQEAKAREIKKLLEQQFNLKLRWDGEVRKWIVEGLEKEEVNH